MVDETVVTVSVLPKFLIPIVAAIAAIVAGVIVFRKVIHKIHNKQDGNEEIPDDDYSFSIDNQKEESKQEEA